MSEPLLRAEALTKSYASGPRRIEVLRALELVVAGGETLAIVGDSGVGKSTLLHLLGGLDKPDAGSVYFRGAAVFDADARNRAEFRNRHVGFIFQFHHLLPEFSALENVEMPFRIARSRAATRERAREILVRLGLGERLDHRPAALSGGEQQRVAIARALAMGPEIVLADEPTGNLDPATGRRVFELLRELQQERAFTLVLASHSERLAMGCDRILRLTEGRLETLDEEARRAYFRGVGFPT